MLQFLRVSLHLFVPFPFVLVREPLYIPAPEVIDAPDAAPSVPSSSEGSSGSTVDEDVTMSEPALNKGRGKVRSSLFSFVNLCLTLPVSFRDALLVPLLLLSFLRLRRWTTSLFPEWTLVLPLIFVPRL